LRFSFHTLFFFITILCRRVNNRPPTENRVVEIYNRIDEFSEENKKKLAVALKHYWQGRGKWAGKQSDKQKVKIQKLKSVLGE